MNAAAFRLAAVGKSFHLGGVETRVLTGIDLEIRQGEFVAIMGPSGSGKSTLMSLLGCLDVPTAGVLEVLGENVGQLDDDRLSALRCRSIGFVFQGFNLLPAYTTTANVALAMLYSHRADRWDRAESLLKNFGMGHRLDARPLTLSGGEQQRVAIARALANDPPILLADEPTGALDQANGRALLELFERLHREGRTIVLVTHDPNVASRAHRVIEIVDGRLSSTRRTL